MSNRIWLHWTDVPSIGSNGKPRVICKYCKSHEQTRHAPKCKRHTIKCFKAPIHVRNKIQQELDSKSMRTYKTIPDDENETDHDFEDSNQCIVLSHVEPQTQQSVEEIRPDSQHNSDSHMFEPIITSEVSYVRHYSNAKKKTTNKSALNGNAIEEYIDTFHRIKKDMKYMLNNTISERKREFIRYFMKLVIYSYQISNLPNILYN